MLLKKCSLAPPGQITAGDASAKTRMEWSGPPYTRAGCPDGVAGDQVPLAVASDNHPPACAHFIEQQIEETLRRLIEAKTPPHVHPLLLRG